MTLIRDYLYSDDLFSLRRGAQSLSFYLSLYYRFTINTIPDALCGRHHIGCCALAVITDV